MHKMIVSAYIISDVNIFLNNVKYNTNERVSCSDLCTNMFDKDVLSSVDQLATEFFDKQVLLVT